MTSLEFPSVRRSQWAGLFGGVLLFVGLLSLTPPGDLGVPGWTVLCLGLLMTVFWFTEALPPALTGVMPFAVLPLLGVLPSNEVAASYFSPVLFLILGGFFLALAMEKWGLHKRVALASLSRTGGSPRAILLATMSTTALLSMFVSNSAATLAMLPVAMAIIAATARAPDATTGNTDHERFGRAMVLGIAYGATLGGFGTIIGSPGNAAAVAIFQRVYGMEISFNLWAAFGMPLVVLGVPLAWLLLSRVIFPFRLAAMDHRAVTEAIGAPGPWSIPDIRLLVIFGLALAGWIGMPLVQTILPTFSDAHVAIFTGIALFVVPAGGRSDRCGQPLLHWDDTRQAPWSLLILIGGGLALADAINATNLSAWLQGSFGGLAGLPPFWQLAMLGGITLLVTEFVTNTATVAAFLPASVALAGGGQIDPVVIGMVVAFSANWGFIMPAGTPSLALAYGTGRLTVPQMAYAGAFMDVAGIVFILAIVLCVGALVL